ncbi:class I SAM-dependent methyltransferase [Polymorphobacter fuscus]|uniref:class I SAM-dependent methyltransferase n=1 Tax=Sandarakinorhabdus fusca TaxID=1439888 RepID=UPI001A9C7718|nr:class I SAM-dependent methyltransferase [Polymorphobacter fuscus]
MLASTPALAFPQPQREVARIVSPAWANEASRDRAGEAANVIRLLGLGAGQTVADIGAGSGYYTVRLSPVVGPRGRVVAQDVVPRYLTDLKRRVRRAGLTNVRFVLGAAGDPKLAPASVDTALMIHMYHEIAQPYALLDRLRGSLKPGGRLAIVDLDRPSEDHGMPKATLVCEVRSVGYDLVSITDLTPGYLAVFKPGRAPDPAAVKACRSEARPAASG